MDQQKAQAKQKLDKQKLTIEQLKHLYSHDKIELPEFEELLLETVELSMTEKEAEKLEMERYDAANKFVESTNPRHKTSVAQYKALACAGIGVPAFFFITSPHIFIPTLLGSTVGGAGLLLGATMTAIGLLVSWKTTRQVGRKITKTKYALSSGGDLNKHEQEIGVYVWKKDISMTMGFLGVLFGSLTIMATPIISQILTIASH